MKIILWRLLKEHDAGKSRMWDTVGSFAGVGIVSRVVKEERRGR